MYYICTYSYTYIYYYEAQHCYTEDEEKHLLPKGVNQVLYKLDMSIRPDMHHILTVIKILLIDED